MDKKTRLFECIDKLAEVTGCHKEAEAAKKGYKVIAESASVPEGILLNLYDTSAASDIGPNGAYNEALTIAEKRFPYLSFPQTREDFQSSYGYDIDTPNMDSIEKRRQFKDFMKKLGEATDSKKFCKAVLESEEVIAREGRDWKSEYGDGGIWSHESNADGFYATERDSLGWAILNNDVESLAKMHDGTIAPPEEPWNRTGWVQDENDEDKYNFDFDRAYEQEFLEDWERVVGKVDNQDALRLMLQYKPDFWLCDADFNNAYHAGYDKELLATLLRKFYALFGMKPCEELEWRNYIGYEGVSIDEMLAFLEGSANLTEAANSIGGQIPDDKVYVSADGTQVLAIEWSTNAEDIDEEYYEQGYDCYTIANLYNVQEGFDVANVPCDPLEVEKLEGKGLTLKGNLAQIFRKSSDIPSDETVIDEYVGDPSRWKLVPCPMTESVSTKKDPWTVYKEAYSVRRPLETTQQKSTTVDAYDDRKRFVCGVCGQNKFYSNHELDNEAAGYFDGLGYVCKECMSPQVDDAEL